jgi:iron complex outermembrane receptor protein
MLKRFLITLLFLSLSPIAKAADVQEIWITPEASDYSRLATGLAGSNITIITSDEIKKSKGKTIPEILNKLSGITIRSQNSGVDSTSTSIDMRGFGESSSRNSLILVNGRRLNDIDMSGVDFSNIPFESIERIEIIRGGSASTIYGDGAVGGAINIVTKDTIEGANVVSLAVGSYDYYKTSFSAPLTINENTGILLSGSKTDSQSYRNEGDYDKENLLVRINHSADQMKLNIDIADSKQNKFLPGPRRILSIDGGYASAYETCNLLSSSRTAAYQGGSSTDPCTTQIKDYGDHDRRSVLAGANYQLSDTTNVITNIGHRAKEQRYFSASNANTISSSSQYDEHGVTNLDTDLVSLSINHSDFVNSYLGTFNIGFDFQESDYKTKKSQGNGDGYGQFVNASQESKAFFMQNTINLPEQNSIISFGLRSESTDYNVNERYDTSISKYQYNTARSDFADSMSNRALNFGVEHKLQPNLIVFGKYAEAFRTPDIDARNKTSSTTGDFVLEEQTSEEFEVGFKYDENGLNLNASIYSMDTKNEIRYVPSFNNTNLDPIKRDGLDIDFDFKSNERLSFNGSFSYVDARFTSGSLSLGTGLASYMSGGTRIYYVTGNQTYGYNSTVAQTYLGSDGTSLNQTYSLAGNKVPLVAEITYSLGMEYEVNNDITGTLGMSFVDERFVSNDQENIEPVIPSYYVFDAQLESNASNKYSWSAGVNNLLNEKYYDFAVASTFHSDGYLGVQAVYPLAERNMFVNFSYNF